jgi:hypothetical protein
VNARDIANRTLRLIAFIAPLAIAAESHVPFDHVGLDPGWDRRVHVHVAHNVLSDVLVVANA